MIILDKEDIEALFSMGNDSSRATFTVVLKCARAGTRFLVELDEIKDVVTSAEVKKAQ